MSLSCENCRQTKNNVEKFLKNSENSINSQAISEAIQYLLDSNDHLLKELQKIITENKELKENIMFFEKKYNNLYENFTQNVKSLEKLKNQMTTEYTLHEKLKKENQENSKNLQELTSKVLYQSKVLCEKESQINLLNNEKTHLLNIVETMKKDFSKKMDDSLLKLKNYQHLFFKLDLENQNLNRKIQSSSKIDLNAELKNLNL